MIEVLSLPADASADERFRVAQLAAGAKQWKEAAKQLEKVLEMDPGNEKAQQALEKIKAQL